MAKASTTIDCIALDADNLIYTTGFILGKDIDPASSSKQQEAINILESLLASQVAGINRHFGNGRRKLDEPAKYLRERMQNVGTFKAFIGPPDKSNFRFEVAKRAPYKGNRTEEKHVFHSMLREYGEKELGFKVVSGMEADDACAMIADEWNKEGRNVLVVGEDKDLDQIPKVFRYWRKDKKEYPRLPYFTGHEGHYCLERNNSGQLQLFSTGKYRLVEQVFRGDSSDGIPSLRKGWGPLDIYRLFTENSTTISSIRTLYDVFQFVRESLINDLRSRDIHIDLVYELDELESNIREQIRLVKLIQTPDELNKNLDEIEINI